MVSSGWFFLFAQGFSPERGLSSTPSRTLGTGGTGVSGHAGKRAHRYRQGTKLVLPAPDEAEVFAGKETLAVRL